MGTTGRGDGWKTVGRKGLRVIRLALRAALLTLPLSALDVLFRPRGRPPSGLSDHQLRDIGLTRADVDRPGARPTSAELETQRLLRGRDWR